MNELPGRARESLLRLPAHPPAPGSSRDGGPEAGALERIYHRLNLEGTDFAGRHLAEGTFYGSNLRGANFGGADLTAAHFVRSSLKGAIFEGSRLDRTQFIFSDLSGVRFDGQTLTGAVFEHAGLMGATFRGATLLHVTFRFLRRHGHLFVRRSKGLVVARFDPRADQADFDGARIDEATFAQLQAAGADLSGVTLLA
ncbi:pentapeptide repeat-containing protein [Cohnella sp. REN36]|uniref:pentapeptide repeat-containing protein n=1 Tax=Cohnella sp. REN36 TaxID=2887347 RepID=UPI001D15C383|nr:pentapeptide repeat-containing protein [Cohnella sp. REN36]MCC3376829.1 pentapeptide repeat-containing protein [Cohnella sp. REN36]